MKSYAHWTIKNVMVDLSAKRFCVGFVVDDGYHAIYLGPISIIWFQKLTLSVPSE